jgi:hypothetical protein
MTTGVTLERISRRTLYVGWHADPRRSGTNFYFAHGDAQELTPVRGNDSPLMLVFEGSVFSVTASEQVRQEIEDLFFVQCVQ